MKDDELVRDFESGALSPDLFNHRAHVRVAWWYLTHCPEDEAMERIKRNLQAFATRNGSPEKYDEGLTSVLMLRIAECVRKSGDLAWPAFADRYPELFAHRAAEPGPLDPRIDRVP